MNRYKSMGLKGLLLILVLTVVLLAGCSGQTTITELPPEDNYTFDNSDVSKAQPDAGIVIDGVLDEAVYQENNWLYLHNEDGGNKVNIAMTSHYGEKGMYFVFDVTESVPIYVNPDRASYMNSCIELYLAPSYVSSVQANSILEIDLLPTGDMHFKKSNGAYGYTNVITTYEKMAVMGATTKGGPVNTEDCYGYNMELFIPWDYLQWLEMDVAAMKDGFVYVSPAHITSNNFTGTNPDLDRYWYFYAQQNGAGFNDVVQYFRFNGEGVLGTIPVELQQGEHYTVSGFPYVLPGMTTVATVTPDEGYALTSVLVNGQEQIRNVHYNQDGSVTLTVRSTADGVKISAKDLLLLADEVQTGIGRTGKLKAPMDLRDFAAFVKQKLGCNGLRYIDGCTNAVLSGKVVQTVDCGTHTLFIAEVTDARVLSNDKSVTYQYYFDHIKPKPEKKKGWVCKICGYVYEGEELPADFVCPLCKHGAEDFERQK